MARKQDNFTLYLSFTINGKIHYKEFKQRTIKQAFYSFRTIQQNYKGVDFNVHIYDKQKNCIRLAYYSENEAIKWLKRFSLRQGWFDSIIGYKSIMQGA